MTNVRTFRFAEGSARLLSHLVDLDAVQFGDSGNQVWLQYLPLGLYQHPVHGEINITPQKVARMVKNFNDKVREQDLDVDYEHKMLDTKAAGWIKAAEDRGAQGLWVQVDFTDPALQALRNKEYKYFSAEFADEWTHPKTKSKHKDVMFGGALTNRPFIKDIVPINLSEMLGQPHQEYKTPTTGGPMDSKVKARLIKLYKLSDTATDEEVLEAAESDPPEPEPRPETEEERVAREAAEADDAKIDDEDEKQLSELAKTNPAIKIMLAERKETQKRMAALETATRLSETTIKLNAMNESGKFAIPPAISDAAKKLIVRLPVQLGEEVIDLLGEFTKLGLVELGERGTPDPKRSQSRTDSESFIDKVTKLTEGEKGLSFAEASLQVAAQDPEGFAAYREESYDFKA